MTTALPRSATRPSAPPPAPQLHHIAVQTPDLDNSVRWYRDFFGAEPVWTLDEFSELTTSRLPGIVRLTEVTLGAQRFHLFERTGDDGEVPGANRIQFQHVCLAVDTAEDVHRWRDRWLELHAGGDYTFASDELPTDVVVDEDGVLSLYLVDPNGLEFEFTHVPAGADR